MHFANNQVLVQYRCVGVDGPIFSFKVFRGLLQGLHLCLLTIELGFGVVWLEPLGLLG